MVRRPIHPWKNHLLLSGILLVGLLVRLLLVSFPGYEFDVGVNQGWGRSAVELGLAHSYEEQVNGNMLPNYAPFSIMLFAGAAWVQQEFFGGFEGVDPLSYRILIKFPAIIAELLTIGVFFFMGKRMSGIRTGAIAGLLYALHPAVLHNGAFWGQTDSIFTFFLVSSLYAFVCRHPLLAGMFLALALLSKMQAVILLPFFFILYARGGWSMLIDGILGALAITVPILLPFGIGGTLDTVANVYIGSVGYYSMVSSAAYNFWWSLYADRAGELQDTLAFLGMLTYRQTGLLLFGISYIFALSVFWKHLRPSPTDLKTLPSLFLCAAFIALSFFLWNTQMHERYLFPFVALGLPMVFIDRRATGFYFWISFLFLCNLLGWLHATTVDRLLFEELPTLDVFIASAQVITYFLFIRYILNYTRSNESLIVFKNILPRSKR